MVTAKTATHLKVQQNGWIVQVTTKPGSVHSTGARDLRFALEYKASTGVWVQVHGDYADEGAARRALADSNPRITYRLVAFNDYGRVALPKGWEGPRQ